MEKLDLSKLNELGLKELEKYLYFLQINYNPPLTEDQVNQAINCIKFIAKYYSKLTPEFISERRREYRSTRKPCENQNTLSRFLDVDLLSDQQLVFLPYGTKKVEKDKEMVDVPIYHCFAYEDIQPLLTMKKNPYTQEVLTSDQIDFLRNKKKDLVEVEELPDALETVLKGKKVEKERESLLEQRIKKLEEILSPVNPYAADAVHRFAKDLSIPNYKYFMTHRSFRNILNEKSRDMVAIEVLGHLLNYYQIKAQNNQGDIASQEIGKVIQEYLDMLSNNWTINQLREARNGFAIFTPVNLNLVTGNPVVVGDALTLGFNINDNDIVSLQPSFFLVENPSAIKIININIRKIQGGIINIPPNSLNNVTEFYCDNCQLTELDLSNLPSLKVLYCRNNFLTKLKINNNKLLEFLNCSDNNLNGDFAKQLNSLTNLSNLDCSDNLIEIDNFEIDKLKNLDYFDCSSNTRIKKLDLRNNEKLDTFIGTNSNIESLNLPSSLRLLLASNNLLGSINLKEIPNIVTIKLSNNNISGDVNFSVAENLRLLDCSNNKINKIDISNCTRLNELNCDKNNLRELNTENNTFLNSLNCSNNKIKSLDIKNNKKITHLKCFNNLLETLDCQSMKKLNEIDCHSNKLLNLKVTGCLRLTILLCMNNKLETLILTKNTRLKALIANSNNITSVKLPQLKNKRSIILKVILNDNNLKKLNAINTKINKLDLSGNDNLKCVDLSGSLPPRELILPNPEVKIIHNNENEVLKNVTYQ